MTQKIKYFYFEKIPVRSTVKGLTYEDFLLFVCVNYFTVTTKYSLDIFPAASFTFTHIS